MSSILVRALIKQYIYMSYILRVQLQKGPSNYHRYEGYTREIFEKPSGMCFKNANAVVDI